MNNNYAVEADYKEQLVNEYEGNPFIEALPPIFNKADVINKIAFYPKFDVKEREYEAHIRLHLIQRLFTYFQPLPIHLVLESRMSRILRMGYAMRNPITSKYVRDLNNGYKDILNEQITLGNGENYVTTSSGFSLIGVSGMGKSTILSKLLSTMPQVILHSNYRGRPFSMTQLTYLKLDCPFDGSLRGLCMEYFSSVDRVLSTNYFEKYSMARLSANAMLPIINQISRNIGLGLLVVDEIQNLSLAKSGGSEKMLNYFVSLVNLSIPVILVGTPKAMPILQGEFRQARRGQGDFVWDRLKKDKQWDLLIEGLWDYQWVRNPQPLTKEISDVLFDECQGIIDICVKLFFMAQVRAISSRQETITPKLIRKVADENLKLVRPMLQSLKNGVKGLSLYNDIMVLDISNFINNKQKQINLNSTIEQFKKVREEKNNMQSFDLKKEVTIRLLDLGFKQEEINIYLDQVISLGETDINKITRTMLGFLMKTGNNGSIVKKKTKKSKIELKDKNDIRYIAKECKEEEKSIYDGLKNNNYIKELDRLIMEVV
ncbi:ATP-binding protein [Clostridium beijerinckii]|uniref:ATP-binding protein n=1 Tax=Clostridium beijerinckii TaxID=1520 RepID=UPI001360F67A|nr:ATP-binding protein [Clostridium beijerinckii]MZK48998.1 AAA family ATPase [Clostridium beijerinckii]MZK57373.1 AAA family ATPase [Clostridium beijerinckii]MZK67584.1 AAA family ATPase [Clostridium beijerinckii]MZK72669.1 AAA family ATPase [Clostridium beijerinckii]MZK82265.1 AAA family ATPase [Clostridium beijerinckii]